MRFALIMAFAKSGPGKIAPLGEQFFKSERPADAPFGSGIQTSDLPVPSSPVHLAFSHVASSQRLKFPVAGQWIHLGPINGKCRVISCESFTDRDPSGRALQTITVRSRLLLDKLIKLEGRFRVSR